MNDGFWIHIDEDYFRTAPPKAVLTTFLHELAHFGLPPAPKSQLRGHNDGELDSQGTYHQAPWDQLNTIRTSTTGGDDYSNTILVGSRSCIVP